MGRIVVVDGDPDVGRLIALVLRLAGHEALEARPGAEALAVLRRERPDAAVLDAEAGGVELALALAAEPATAGVAVVLTSTAGAAARRDAEAVRANFLSKPFAPDALRALVEATLGTEAASTDTP